MDQVGPYRVLGVLSESESGVRFRAHDPGTDSPVVLTLLKVEDPLSLARIEREATALKRLAHPRLVPLLDSGEHAGQPYLVLPWIEGESLQDRLDRTGPLPVEDALRAMSQVGEALAAVHAAGLVHRDLKPANVLLDAHGDALLTGFGLGHEQASELGSPEQAREPVEQIGPASDVYSLAATLYALLSGVAPRRGVGFAKPVQPLVRVRDDVPVWVEDLLQRCFEREPAGRPSLSELLEALDASTHRVRAPRLSNMGRLWILAQGASLAIGLGLLGWWVFGSPRKPSPDPAAPALVEPANSE